ncbi:hypothetical protein C8F01DRAFT_1005127, partial [Mycena amicta]
DDRLMFVCAGRPAGADWDNAMTEAADMMEAASNRVNIPVEKQFHRRAQEGKSYPLISRGVSFGGGQKEPGQLKCTPKLNEQATDDMLAAPCFQRIIQFTMSVLLLWHPMLYLLYRGLQNDLRRLRPGLNWAFISGVFAACTFNLIKSMTGIHVDYANLAWGWCAITALGNFDPDFGGHLILHDLRLVIRFPPGSTILIPSALLRHSNVPIRPGERRSSFTQYTAGGLFRWADNGGRTDDEFEATATAQEKQARNQRDARRWEEGMSFFPTLDEIRERCTAVE